MKIILLLILGLFSDLAHASDTWPPIAFSEAKKNSKKLDVRKLYDHLKKTEKGPMSLEKKLKYVISHHPVSLINKDMFNEIYTQEKLPYSFLEEEGLSGQFEEAEVSGKLIPVIIINPKILNIKSEDNVYFTLLILYHEYLHYIQWKKADSRIKKYFRTKKADEHLSEDRCTHQWGHEREAYHKECLLALEWGKPEIFSKELCNRASSNKAFDQALFEILESWPNHGLVSDCKKSWAKAAGHPHPEIL